MTRVMLVYIRVLILQSMWLRGRRDLDKISIDSNETLPFCAYDITIEM